MGKGEGCGEGGLVGSVEGVRSELVGLTVGLLVGDLVGTVDGELMREGVVVIAGQKPHALGHEAPTSNPAFRRSSPR